MQARHMKSLALSAVTLSLVACETLSSSTNTAGARQTLPPKPAALHGGSAVVLVDVDSSGRVTGARILESTGSPALDEAALRKFRQWHFKPGAPPHIRIPIRFTVSGEMY